MLTTATPFPYIGSYALIIDQDGHNDPAPLELARIVMRRGNDAVIAFPLRDGASGNKTVPLASLIDATPLTAAEQREFHELDRALRGKSMRTPRQKQMGKWRDALRSRLLHAPKLAQLLRSAGQLRKAA